MMSDLSLPRNPEMLNSEEYLLNLPLHYQVLPLRILWKNVATQWITQVKSLVPKFNRSLMNHVLSQV